MTTSSVLQKDVTDALWALLVSLVPNTVEVVLGQQNRVGIPSGTTFIVITPMGQTRRSTNRITYTDPQAANPASTAPGSKNLIQPTLMNVQVDVYGPGSSEIANEIETVCYDAYAFDFFAGRGIDARITEVSDPTQTPWISSESQYVDRWTLTVGVQVNSTVSIPQDFAAVVVVTPIVAELVGITEVL